MTSHPEPAEAARKRVRRTRANDRGLRGASVLVGKNGWLFLANDTNDVIGQHTGRVRLSQGELNEWERVIRARGEDLTREGVEWLSVIAPDKEGVYAEYLPDEIVPTAQRPVHEILRIAETAGASFVYPLNALERAKGGVPLYGRTGTHWTHRGAFIAFRVACRALESAGVPLAESSGRVRWHRFSSRDDLGEKLAAPRKGINVQATLETHHSRLVFDNLISNHGRIIIFERDDERGPTAVLFGESFTNQMLIFLKERFRRLVFLHTSTLPRQVIALERPDVVLSVPTERFLCRPPIDDQAEAQITEAIRDKCKSTVFRPAPTWFLDEIPGAGDVTDLGEVPWELS